MDQSLRKYSGKVPDDQYFAAEIMRGNKQALSALYDRYATTLFGIIHRFTADEHKSEEILQQVFLRVWNEIGSYERSGLTLFAWLLNMTRTAVGTLKNQKVVPEIHLADNFVSNGKSKVAHKENAGKDGKSDLANLAIDLVYIKGYGILAAAQELGLAPHELRKRLREELNNFRAKKGK
jgi:RNA polymerase sigma-70 factor, ECF subfamily